MAMPSWVISALSWQAAGDCHLPLGAAGRRTTRNARLASPMTPWYLNTICPQTHEWDDGCVCGPENRTKKDPRSVIWGLFLRIEYGSGSEGQNLRLMIEDLGGVRNMSDLDYERTLLEVLSRNIPAFRNELAHGFTEVHDGGFRSVALCADLINQLYEKP